MSATPSTTWTGAVVRLMRHRWHETRASGTLGPEVLQRLGRHVAASEQLHTGQIRIVVESSLPWSYLRRHALARERAVMLFSKYRVWDTAQNNGVLIYLLMAEQAIEIVADRGLAKHVGGEDWQTVVTRMAQSFSQQRYEEGLLQAIDVVSSRLVQHFPRSADSALHNELPDEPIVR